MTATTVVTETSIPTFALVVHPVGDSSTMYRLGTRVQGSRKEPTNRILTYIKPGTSSAPDASFKGIDATIIDGRLYIMSKNDKPKLYGFSKQFSGESQYAGRTVLARQPGNDKTSSSTVLTGCTIDRSKGGIITCKSIGGEAVALQELAWPGRKIKGRFMLGLVPASDRGGEEDQPRMQLAAESFGFAVVGC